MLIQDKTRVENGVTIREKIIPSFARANKDCASWCKKGQPMKPCEKLTYGMCGVTIHNTSDIKNVNDDAEQYTRATWPNCNMGGVVVHYYVDDLGAWQNLREDEAGWHASDGLGKGNFGTIALEVIMDGSGSVADLKAEENAIKLAASILHRYKLGIESLYTHNHWMKRLDKIVWGIKKNCPIYLLPHWTTFQSRVKTEIEKLKKIEMPKIENQPIVPTIKVGSKIKIKSTATNYATGQVIPSWAKSQSFTVMKLSAGNVLLKEIISWVKLSDVTFI